MKSTFRFRGALGTVREGERRGKKTVRRKHYHGRTHARRSPFQIAVDAYWQKLAQMRQSVCKSSLHSASLEESK